MCKLPAKLLPRGSGNGPEFLLSLEFLFSVIGCLLFFEGIPYFLSPQSLKKVMVLVIQMDDSALRRIGFTLMACGLLSVASARFLWS